MSIDPSCGRAGFWRRLAAIWIDTLIVYLACSFAFWLLVKCGVYFPFELTAIVAGATYAVIATAWKGGTLGKLLCGLRVEAKGGGRVGLLRVLVRETLGKLLSAVLLFGGFLWAAWTRSKRALHDYIAGTVVTQARGRRARWIAASSIGTLIAALLLYAGQLAWLGRIYVSMAPRSPYALRYASRNPAELLEVAAAQSEPVQLAEWLGKNGREPLEYAVAKAKAHRVVIFGEMHNQRQTLEFVNQAIPELYSRAGITVVAMETLMARDNKLLERLVSSPSFDRSAVLELSRTDLWAVWGYKEYWDVIETVWRVNQQRSASQPPLRLVGLGIPADLPSFALLGFEKNPGSHAPWWERLRVLRLPIQLPRAVVRDAWLAREVEKEILKPGARGIVWVGSAHSCIHCPRPSSGRGDPRMGFMLAQKYGGDVFQVVMHARFLPTSQIFPDYRGPDEQMTEFIERVMKARGNKPVGFDVDGSPFARLRDSGAWKFYPNIRLGLADIAAGYVYLVPSGETQPCTWMKGYLTDEMFTRNKPFYESFGIHYKRRVANARDAEELLRIDE